MTSGYQPDFDVDLTVGEWGEHSVRNFFAMHKDRLEVKNVSTGLARNLFVEVRQNPHRRLATRPYEWPASGFATTRSTFGVWRSQTSGAFIAVPTSHVQAAIDRRQDTPYDIGGARGDNPTAGFWVPFRELLDP